MKIILIGSSLEPGKDGVGDYTRILGAALVKQGVTVALLALNDRYVTEIYQSADEEEFSILRIPALSLQKNIPQVKAWINNFNPDWLSLQYVIFGYHPKGLPFGLSKHLLSIGAGRRWHIMFHELWLGMAQEESRKLKLWGIVQRYLIKSLIGRLQPKAIHTQTQLYQQQLGKLGYTANYLPIFSNIPVKPDEVNTKAEIKPDNFPPPLLVLSPTTICLVVFGLIHTGAAIEELAADAARYAQKHDTNITLTFVGNCGNEQKKWAATWQQAGLSVVVLGQQPADKISILLQKATMGIASTAMAVIEKSGAFAAMRDHQLPVLNISKPWTPHGISPPEIPQGVVAYQTGDFEPILAHREKYITTGVKPEIIAQQMMNDLLTNA